MSVRTSRSRALRAAAVAALALAALVVPGSQAAWSGAGVLATDAPATVYDAVAHAPLSSVAGETVYVMRGDLNGDDFPDLVNVTSRGAQVFLNEGTTAGVFSMALVQEIPLQYSYGGGAFDADGDGDLDLVMGEMDHVAIVLNDGTGQFAVTKPVRHDFAYPTIAVPFRSMDCPEGKFRIAVCAASDTVAGDKLGPNPTKQPFLYVLEEGAPGSFHVLQRMDRMNCGGIAVRDWDGDGDNDIAASSRSYEEPPNPVFLYNSCDAQGCAGYSTLLTLGTADIGNYFSYRPHIAANGNLLFGAWHHQSFMRRNAYGWEVAKQAGCGPFATGESWGNDLADMDCDGEEDMVFAGRFTPVSLARTIGDPNEPSERFTAPAHPGSSTEVSATDWDQDEFAVPDVIVGGTDGLFILRNQNGGEAHTPGWSPLRPSHEPLLEAYQKLTTLLDPTRVPPLETVEARFYAALCQTYLDFMHPSYLTDGTLQGMTNAEKVAFLQGTYDSIHLCDWYLYVAKLWAAGEPEDVATIVEIRALLTESSISLLDEAIGLGGSVTTLPPNPSKMRKTNPKSVTKLFRQVLRDRDAARQYAALARMETRESRRDHYTRRAQELTGRAAETLSRVWYLNSF